MSETWSRSCPCGREHGSREPSRMKAKTCAACGSIHVASDAVAVNRFSGVTGYRTSDGEIHPTREAAQKWLCEQRQADPTA